MGCGCALRAVSMPIKAPSLLSVPAMKGVASTHMSTALLGSLQDMVSRGIGYLVTSSMLCARACRCLAAARTRQPTSGCT